MKGRWAPSSRIHSTQLIGKASARVLHARLHQEISVAQPLDVDIVIQPKARRSRKRKPDPSFAVSHAIAATSATPVKSQSKAKKGKFRRQLTSLDIKMATTVGQAVKALDDWLQCPSAQLSCTSCSEWPHIPKADTTTTRMDFDAWRKDRQLRRRPDARSNGRELLVKHIQSGLPDSQRSIG